LQIGAYPPLAPLVLVLKVYLRSCGLNEVANGGISSFALTNMVLAHIMDELQVSSRCGVQRVNLRSVNLSVTQGPAQEHRMALSAVFCDQKAGGYIAQLSGIPSCAAPAAAVTAVAAAVANVVTNRTAMTCLTWVRHCTASWCGLETTLMCTG
jgi:hypothetical protein